MRTSLLIPCLALLAACNSNVGTPASGLVPYAGSLDATLPDDASKARDQSLWDGEALDNESFEVNAKDTGTDNGSGKDADTADAGPMDSGTIDAGPKDAGASDSATPDGGPTDAIGAGGNPNLNKSFIGSACALRC